MSAFTRAVVPNEFTEYRFASAPFVSVGHSGKSQQRGTTAVGITWSESWPIIDHLTAAGRAFISEVRFRLNSPDSFTIAPYRYLAAMGTVPAGTAGEVNGASQTGTMFTLDNFAADGTLAVGDYLTGIGPGAVDIRAAATVSGGAVTVEVWPPVYDIAHAPADGAAVTLNGLVNARIANAAQISEWLATVQQTEHVDGLTLVFQETL